MCYKPHFVGMVGAACCTRVFPASSSSRLRKRSIIITVAMRTPAVLVRHAAVYLAWAVLLHGCHACLDG